MSADQTEQPDEEIVARILGGEVDRFEALYSRYHPKVFQFAFKMTGRREQAEDLAHDILARVYQNLRGFRADSTFKTWVYRITLNHCLNDRRRTNALTFSIEDLDEIPSHQIRAIKAADEEVLTREIQLEVQRALLSLPPRMRALVLLKEIEDLSYEQLAEQFGLPVGTVGSKLTRARQLLAKKLEHLKGKI